MTLITRLPVARGCLRRISKVAYWSQRFPGVGEPQLVGGVTTRLRSLRQPGPETGTPPSGLVLLVRSLASLKPLKLQAWYGTYAVGAHSDVVVSSGAASRERLDRSSLERPIRSLRTRSVLVETDACPFARGPKRTATAMASPDNQHSDPMFSLVGFWRWLSLRRLITSLSKPVIRPALSGHSAFRVTSLRSSPVACDPDRLGISDRGTPSVLEHGSVMQWEVL